MRKPDLTPSHSGISLKRVAMPRQHRKLILVVFLCVSLVGCFGNWAKRLADKEVYPILAQKQIQALGQSRDMTLEEKSDDLTRKVLTDAGKASDEFTTEGLRITLADTLALSVHNGRDYQSQKESLYLSALDLTLARHQFSPIFTGLVTSAYSADPVIDATNHVADATRAGSLATNLSVSQIVAATGARITVGFANSFSRFFSAPADPVSTGVASASVVQPLLRGAGMRVATENLKQTERDVIYQVRDFSRFEKKFIVDHIEEFYRLLQRLDTVVNEKASYDRLKAGRERNEALSQAGRIDIFQVDQSRQEELTARNRWVAAQTTFVQQLDQLKFNLGLPTDLKIFPDQRELESLSQKGLEPIELKGEEAVGAALKRRLDYLTVQQRVEDQERKLHVFENSLLPDLNLTADISIPDEGRNHPLDLDWKRRSYDLGADLKLPLDRKKERNAYRAALIELDRRKRTLHQTRDSIVREVRTSFQNLDLSRASYEIQKKSLEVAQRRVDSATMLLEAGRKTVRDVLESEDALRNARNALTGALVDYVVARLRFLVAIEGLEVENQGEWKESPKGNSIVNAKS